MTQNNDLIHHIFFDDDNQFPIFSQKEEENLFDENIK